MRFRTYLLLSILCAVLFPLAVLSYFQHTAAVKQISEEDETQKHFAELVSESIERRIQSAQNVLDLAAAFASQVPPPKQRALNKFLLEIHSVYPEFLNLHFDNAEGRTVAFYPSKNAEDQSNIGVDHTDRPHWHRIQEKAFAISDVFTATGASSDRIVNIIGHPSTENPPLYAVAALDLTALAEELLKSFAHQNYLVGLADSKGTAVFASFPHKDAPFIPEKILEKLRASDKFIWESFTLPDGEEVVGEFHPIRGTPWSIGVFRTVEERNSSIMEAFVFSFLSFALVLLTTGVLAQLASMPLIRAVKALGRQVSAKRAFPLPDEKITAPQELKELQSTFGIVQNELALNKNRLVDLNRNLQKEVRRQVEKIAQQDEMLRSVFAGLTDGVLLYGEDGKVLYSNPLAEKMLGAKKLDRPVIELLSEAFTSQSSEKVWLSGNTVRLYSKSGPLAVDLQSFEVASCSEGKLRGLLMHDISEQEGLNRMKDDLIGMAAHELKTPLSGLKLQADYLKLAAGKISPDELKDVADDLNSEVDRLRLLVSNWLDVAKMDSGFYQISEEIAQIKPVIEKAAEIARKEGAFDFSLEISEDAECFPFDPDAMTQVFVNLFTNAVRYARKGVMPAVKVKVEEKGGEISISVSDNGEGISSENQSKVFDRFFQVKRGARRKSGGTGLGLVICEGIVKLHHGGISLSSQVGKGTTFCITLPG